MLKVLGLIPARGGSKGVPRKNIRELCGKPLLAYTAESAFASKQLARIILSTEDEEVARVGREIGLDVPFTRPPDLAADDTPTFPVVEHALDTLELEGDCFDAVCLLQPTNPFRLAEHIDGCIDLLERTGADSVVTVRRVPDEYNPGWVYWKESDGSMTISTGEAIPASRRQELRPAFHRDGSIYVTRCSSLRVFRDLYGKNLRGFETQECNHVNIDTPQDWEAATLLLSGRSSSTDI